MFHHPSDTLVPTREPAAPGLSAPMGATRQHRCPGYASCLVSTVGVSAITTCIAGLRQAISDRSSSGSGSLYRLSA